MAAQVAILPRFVWVLLGLQLMFLDQLGAEAGRRGMVVPNDEVLMVQTAEQHEQLPLCDFKHRRVGVDCSGWPHAPDYFVDHVSLSKIAPPESTGEPAILLENIIQGGLAPPPPCQYKWQFPGYDCWPPIGQPPVDHVCDRSRLQDGIDCVGAPPAVADDEYQMNQDQSTASAAGSAGAQYVAAAAALPACGFYGAIPGRNCYDLPRGSLPPCTDFLHQRPGFDCWPSGPPAPPDPPTAASHWHQQWQAELPLCDFQHHRPGFDCWPSPPPPPPPPPPPRLRDDLARRE